MVAQSLMEVKNELIFYVLFPRRAHSTEQTPFTKMSPPGTHFSADSIEAMRNKCLAQGHDILMQLEFEPSIAVSNQIDTLPT